MKVNMEPERINQSNQQNNFCNPNFNSTDEDTSRGVFVPLDIEIIFDFWDFAVNLEVNNVRRTLGDNNWISCPNDSGDDLS